MKNNLEVHEFSLKRIVENLDKIPSRGKLIEGFSEEVKKLSPQEKKSLMEKISKFNEYGKVLRCETAIKELVNTVEEIANMAESYAMTEASDYFQQEVIKRDFKQMKGITKDFKKLAQECYGKLMQLNALYEDNGKLLERYFEIKSLDEYASGFEQEEGMEQQDEIVGDEIQGVVPKDEERPQDVPQEGDPLLEVKKKFLQKAIKPSHSGYCTPMTKSTCTPRRKALAKRLKPGGDLYAKVHGEGLTESDMEEVAPPGFGAGKEHSDIYKKVKAQYPGEPAKAYATMWKIHNKMSQ